MKEQGHLPRTLPTAGQPTDAQLSSAQDTRLAGYSSSAASGIMTVD